MKAIPFIFLFCLFIGCASAPSPKSQAGSHVQPILVALKAYHHAYGEYPEQLDELLPCYLQSDVRFFDNKDPNHSWELSYQRISQNKYKLCLDSTPCSQAVYSNGRFISAAGPNYQ